MKKLWMLVALILILAACGADNADTATEPADNEQLTDQTETKDEGVADDQTEDDSTTNDNNEAATENPVDLGENLLKKDFAYEFEDGDVKMTINLVEFTQEFTTTSGGEDRNSLADNEILIHVKGIINNDTVDGFSFGNPLAPVKFKLLYDDKHEFVLVGDSESSDGKTFDASIIPTLQEQIFHMHTNVPLPVAETDKSLVLIIISPNGEEKIELR